MKKIPMLFTLEFDEKGNSTVNFDKFNDKAIAALTSGDATPTQKVDGTAMMLDDDGNWWARRIVKPGKKIPADFLEVTFDENTGKRVGWIPAQDSPFAKFWRKALDNADGEFVPASYELIGPKVNGNPENVEKDTLVQHGTQPLEGFPSVGEMLGADNAHDLLEPIFADFRERGIEGVVWWVNGEPVVKLRAKDFFPEMDSRNR